MSYLSRLFFSFWVLGLALFPLQAGAEIELDGEGNARLSADYRLRFESDWDSRRADGTEREDRDRFRVRARLGLKIMVHDRATFGLRLRTGSRDSQQSPHITLVDFDQGSTGDAHAVLDQWYLELKAERISGWTGRHSFPFWKSNEFLWDDDVTPAGVFVALAPLNSVPGLSLRLGYFSLPDGMEAFGPEMGAAQVVYFTGPLTLAGGYFGIRGREGAENLRHGNGERDYSLWVASIQASLSLGSRPLRLGFDYFHNSEDYSQEDLNPFTANHHDQKDGWDFYLKWGQTKKRGDWLLAYYYAEVEAFAVNASYAQDDWVRWGSATQTDSSDIRGHEFRFAYSLGHAQNLVARLYLVEAITSDQDGNRFRLDYNLKF